MEAVLVLFAVVILAAAIVGLSRSTSASSGISTNASSYGGTLVGAINLTNGSVIDYPNGASHLVINSPFNTLAGLTSDLFSYNSTTNEITVTRDGNYVISYDITPSDNVISSGFVDINSSLAIFSVTQNKTVLFLPIRVGDSTVGASINILTTTVSYLQTGVYSIVGNIIVDNTGPAKSVPVGGSRFSITTLY